ncbi:HtaA domain-containing protein [Streptomyces sp. NPDC058319]|uniref:HtaA domain-containing protein n=1 Tax=unclassified Streptomyces TaxID=2593676 RepID=UPI0036E40CFB
MSRTTGGRSRRRPLALAAAVATVTATVASVGAAALAGAPGAAAADRPLSGYELTWGIKDSYRSYVTGPYAKGTFTTTDGAVQASGNGAFTFTGGQGTYNGTTHAVHLTFKGTLTAESSAHRFKRVLSDFQYDSGTGVLTADLTADDGTTRQDVPFAEVAAPTSADMTGLATKLTTQAGTFLGSDTYAGAAGDPLSVVKKEVPASPSPSTGPSTEPSSPSSPPASASSSPTQSTGTSPSPSAPATGGTGTSPSPSATTTGSSAPVPARGVLADGRLTWGVKASFRSYVTGSLAKGTITASGGASQASGNGAFTFTDATGSYDTQAGTLSAAFKGAVNFKGHKGEGKDGGYGLDLTLSGVKASFSGTSGRLTADVTSLGKLSEGVVLADLKAPAGGLTPKGDVISLSGVGVTLTDAGATAFSGFYPKGTVLDPLNLSVALTDGAELPSGDGTSGSSGGAGSAGTGGDAGTGGGPASGTGGTAGGIGSTTGGTGSTIGGGSLASTGSGVPVAALGSAAAAAVAAGAGVVFALRRRRDATQL